MFEIPQLVSLRKCTGRPTSRNLGSLIGDSDDVTDTDTKITMNILNVIVCILDNSMQEAQLEKNKKQTNAIPLTINKSCFLAYKSLCPKPRLEVELVVIQCLNCFSHHTEIALSQGRCVILAFNHNLYNSPVGQEYYLPLPLNGQEQSF